MTDRAQPNDTPLLRAIRGARGDAGVGGAPASRFCAADPGDPNGGAGDLAAMMAHRERREPTFPARPAGIPPRVEPVCTIVEQIRRGASPQAQLDRALGRIAILEPAMRAFVWVGETAARDAARALEGAPGLPLAGVPIAHKDILWTAGVPTTAGSALLADHVPTRDATVVRRLATAGAISVGKVNTHEFATGVTGRVSVHGPTLNPVDRTRVPGGSSCGSAAAVAAGMVAAATATDTGGSIRIPAACCGVVGFKPTYGAVPVDGVIPFSWSLDHVGVIAGCVTDAAHVHSVMAGDAPPATPPPASTDRIRFALPEGWQARCDEATAGALERLAESMVAAGAERVRVAEPPLEQLAAIAGAIFLAEGGALHQASLREFPDLYQPETVAFLSQASGVSATDYVAAQRRRAAVARAFAALHERVDVLLVPALPTPAPAIETERVELPGGALDVRAALTLFTRPFNLTGQPVVCLPIGRDASGLPISAQLVGAVGTDRGLLGRATWIEGLIAG